jgi:hypothetical protein
MLGAPYDEKVGQLHFSAGGCSPMDSRAELSLQNGAMKSYFVGMLSWELFATLYTWKYIPLNYFGLDALVTLIVTLGFSVYLLCSGVLNISQHRLDASKALWRYVIDAFPMLRLLRGVPRCMNFFVLAMGVWMIFSSLRFEYYTFIAGMTPAAVLQTPECIFMQSCLTETVIIPLGSVALAGLLTQFAVLAKLSRRWQRTVQLSGNDQNTLDALDKLTTLELWHGKTAKADSYSIRLIAVAEKMHAA